MKAIYRRTTLIATWLSIALASGCASAPSRDSGLGRIDTLADNGPWRGEVLSITDEQGREVYSVFKKRLFQSSVELPAGNYEITHTCSPGNYRYVDMPGQWPFDKWKTKIHLNPGDSYKLGTEGKITLGGIGCETRFFGPD